MKSVHPLLVGWLMMTGSAGSVCMETATCLLLIEPNCFFVSGAVSAATHSATNLAGDAASALRPRASLGRGISSRCDPLPPVGGLRMLPVSMPASNADVMTRCCNAGWGDPPTPRSCPGPSPLPRPDISMVLNGLSDVASLPLTPSPSSSPPAVVPFLPDSIPWLSCHHKYLRHQSRNIKSTILLLHTAIGYFFQPRRIRYIPPCGRPPT